MSRTELSHEAPATYEEELLKLLARQGRRMPLPLLIVSAVIAGIAAEHVPVVLPLVWFCFVVLVLALRWIAFGRLPARSSMTVQRRLRIAVALNALSGAAQGLSVGFFFYLPDFERAIQSMLLIGFCAGSVARTGGYMPAFLAYLLPTIVPLSAAWAFSAIAESGAWIEASAALLIALLGGLLANLAQDAFRVFRESFDIRLDYVKLNAELKAANSAKTRFLAAAAHDLRQPMQSLGMFAAVLAMRPLDERSRDVVAHMNAALTELSSEMDALLDISRLDAPIAIERTAVDMRSLVETLRDVVASGAAAKHLELKVECAGGIYAATDRNLFQRLVRNLLENAIKYTDAGSVSLIVEADASTVRVVVADTGPGIPEAEQERVFEEFYQLNNRERDRAKGLGLGLAIVDRLHKLLGIPRDMTSSPGEGTRFVLELPRTWPDEAGASDAPASEPVSLQGLHVLVIDDEARVRLSLTQLLEHSGCRVTGAGSTDQAVTCARLDRPDVVLADFQLRGTDDGISAVSAIRQHYPQMPALLISGDRSPERLRQASGAGMTRVLYKPVAPAALRLAIAEAVGLIDC